MMATKPNKKNPVVEEILYNGANWNEMEDEFTQSFYEQNLSQFWRPEDISLQPDLNVWHVLSDEMKLAYARNLLVLTFLDTSFFKLILDGSKDESSIELFLLSLYSIFITLTRFLDVPCFFKH